jgi:plasmid stabilization system protein ParE
MIPEFPELPHREVIAAPYRFFYKVVTKTVWVVAVWHGAQLPQKPLPKRSV